MKTLLFIIFAPLAILLVVRYEFTPWRLLSPSEVAEMDAKIKQLEAQARNLQQITQGPPRPQISDGKWMSDPTYRTGLERTTIIGRPEGAKARDK